MYSEVLYVKKRIYLIAVILITAFIFSNSAQNAQSSSTQSVALLDLLHRLPLFSGITHTLIRKTAHFGEFMCQGLCLSAYFDESGKKRQDRAVYTSFFGLLTACTDEFIQLFSLGRSSEVKDVFIDFCGTVAAVLVFGVIKRIKGNED